MDVPTEIPGSSPHSREKPHRLRIIASANPHMTAITDNAESTFKKAQGEPPVEFRLKFSLKTRSLVLHPNPRWVRAVQVPVGTLPGTGGRGRG